MNSGKSLSPLLQELVKTHALPESVAHILNRLPQVKQQLEAVEDWKIRLDRPAKEVVAEFGDGKPVDWSPIEVFLDDDQVAISWGYHYYEYSLDDYIEDIRQALADFLSRTPCDFCSTPLMGDIRHANCEVLARYTSWSFKHQQNIERGVDVANNQKWLRNCEAVIQIYRPAYQTGFFVDGTPWSTPRHPLSTDEKDKKTTLTP